MLMQMKYSLVMTILGADRPGLVSSIAALVNRHKGNWLESRMARLAGQFAGILHVECPQEEMEALRSALSNLKNQDIHINIVNEPIWEAENRHTFSIDVVGNDRPGIVHQLARALADAGANVEEWATGLESAPMTGHPLFRVSGKVSMTSPGDEQKLREAIENLSDDLSVEMH
jgi:glycine cleavage system regulatory protein